MTYWFGVTILLLVTLISRGAETPGASPQTPTSAVTSEATPAVAPAPAAAAMPAETPAPPAATPPTPPLGSAVVKGDNVNVRGKPTIHSEVLTQLRQGERVLVLEEITLSDVKSEEQARWTKIALPPTVAVWVHSSFIDATAKTVKPQRLNLRSGPSENHSVVGRVERGTLVKELETQGAWLKIEAPPNAYAFVAAQLLEKDKPTAVVAAAPPAAVQPAMTEPATTQPVAEAAPAPAAPAPAETAAAPPPPPAEATPATETAAAPTEVETPPAEQTIRRVVSREGIVRRSMSVQAPTYFALESRFARKTINYLYSPPSNSILLRDFEGQRILVTGEEMVDERWPNTPVINVEKLRTVP